MTVVVRVRVTGVEAANKKLQQVNDAVNHPTGGLEAATHKVAAVWRDNFASEGDMVGGWAQLGEMTQGMREWQGFSPDHPILFRYGSLQGIAIDFFEKASAGQSASEDDNYSGHKTTGALTINDKVAVLEAHGWKVANQWGHPNKGNYPDTPARPFWFVDDTVIAAAREGVHDWLLDEVKR